MILSSDRSILRGLAKQVVELADRRGRWKGYNSLKPGRPLILPFPEGSRVELLPDGALTCGDIRLGARSGCTGPQEEAWCR